MRNLIVLFKRYYNFFIFLFLQVVFLILVFRNNSYQQASYINSSRNISAAIYDQQSRFFGFWSLRSTNDSLMRENARLKQLIGHAIPANPLKDSMSNRIEEKDSMRTTIHYTYIPARVLNNTIDMKFNHITINKGSADGVKEKMAVISAKGIVGRVSHVNTHFAVISSVLADKSRVSAQVPDGTVGHVLWGGQNPEVVRLLGIPQSVKLKIGDTISTTGYSYFPEHVMIGRIKKKEKDSYQVQLSTNFRNLHYVYVIKDMTNIERILFEDSVTHSENP